ncbi:putative lipoprotein [Enterobacter cancerogenus]|uniref:Putative lipoprotein n=1 Tax=Enterobacter cancerogenus TaxID=69218 RepID=A0A484XSR9_9ENTR|nr:putative lipoprotein [Enterobacter cancerogenus]
MKKTYLYSMLALCVSAACHAETWPAPIGPSQSDFGGVGLLQTPTARMAREGEISLNYRDNDQYRYYSAVGAAVPVARNHACAIPTCARNSTAASTHSQAIKPIKTKPSM